MSGHYNSFQLPSSYGSKSFQAPTNTGNFLAGPSLFDGFNLPNNPNVLAKGSNGFGIGSGLNDFKLDPFSSFAGTGSNPLDSGSLFGNFDLGGAGDLLGAAGSLYSAFSSAAQGKDNLAEQKKQNEFLKMFGTTQLNNEVSLANERAGTRQQTRDLSSNPDARTDVNAQNAAYNKGVSNLGLKKL